MTWRAVGALVVAALLVSCRTTPPADSRQLDGFEDASLWRATGSDQVSARLRSEPGMRGQALCLDYDFHGVSGHALLERPLPIDFPAHYALRLAWRGSAPANDLQVKFVDASGDNVWWRAIPRVTPPATWTPLKIRQRQVDFAWGPTPDRQLRHTETLQLLVASSTGGAGSVCFDELWLQTLPAPVAPPPIRAEASTSFDDAAATRAVDGRADTAWEAPARPGQTVRYTLDFGQPREYGGVVLHWQQGAQATRYDVEASDDGRDWRLLRRVVDGRAAEQPLMLTDAESRYLRFSLHASQGERYALQEVALQDVAFGATPTTLLQALARQSPRGRFPRGMSGEQVYWTLVGVDGGGANAALMSEDGALEVGKAGFSVEPFVQTEGGLVSWADVQSRQSLQDGALPIPSVQWEHSSLRLDVTALANGSPGQSQLAARYRLTNTTRVPQRLALVLAVRPMQVNPPSQFLNTPGGWRPVRRVAWDGVEMRVDGVPVRPSAPPSAATARPFDAGDVLAHLGEATSAQPIAVDDAATGAPGATSGALVYRWTLAPGESASVDWVAPLSGVLPASTLPFEQQRERVAARWRQRLNQVGLTLPRSQRTLVDSVRSAVAHVLMSRDGPALQPGTRSYARSWVRDGAMMAEGLLRMGEDEAASQFVSWFAPYQFDSGKVPCCVDRRGADPVPENDSHGQLIHAIAELHRYTGDATKLRASWPAVLKAAGHMERLRQSERTDVQRRDDARRATFGLMPASISHEGYSAKPVHSYWDDFWALRGYRDAVDIAQALGEREAARRIAVQRDEFERELHASLRATVDLHRIGYLPGSVELGDFDPTSTTIALTPGGEQARLPEGLLRATYERYWAGFVERRDGPAGQRPSWEDYTPYEIRNVGAFLRLGQPQRAREALAFFLSDQRPRGWNQWAEVVGREVRKPRFVGDMPHAWISSDYLRAALDLLAYERRDDQSLVLAAGVPLAWLDEGVGVRGLRTPYGPLSYRLQRRGREVQLDLPALGLRVPPGGIRLVWPGDGPLPKASVNGWAARWQGRELRLDVVPAHVLLR